MPTPPKPPTAIGLEYVPVELELCVVTPPPESEPDAAPVAGDAVSWMTRSYWADDCQVVVFAFVEPSVAVVVWVCEPAS